MLNDERDWHLLEIELQTTGQNGDRDLLRISGCQNKFDMLWGFFQGFEHGIKSMISEHMYLINHVNLIASITRCVSGFF